MTKERAGRGSAVALVAAAVFLSIASPVVFLGVGAALLFLLLPPRAPRALLVGGAVLALTYLLTSGGDPLAKTSALWAAACTLCLVAATVVRPAWGFLARSLAALTVAVVAAAAWFVGRGSWTAFDAAVRARFREAAALWQRQVSGAGAAEWAEQIRASAEGVAALQGEIYPALAVLQTLALLALAWWIFVRYAADEGWPRLGAFRELRFSDSLVWVMIVGLTLAMVPAGAAVRRVGFNLLLFMGALYALRGAAVFAYFVRRGRTPSVLLGLLATLFFPPLPLVASALVGLGDTWLDLRSRLEPAPPG
ncbi:hypothetical protein BH20GEM2_BH20GEM2_06870 [soil metagenome]